MARRAQDLFGGRRHREIIQDLVTDMERFGQFWAADGDRIWKDLVKMELANYQRLPPSHYESLNLDLCVVVEYHLKPGSNDEYSCRLSTISIQQSQHNVDL